MGNSMYHYWKSQPEVLRQILEQRKSQTEEFVKLFCAVNPDKLYLIGSGTSLNAERAAAGYMETMLDVDVCAVPSSRIPQLRGERPMVVFISQGGSSTNTLQAMEQLGKTALATGEEIVHRHFQPLLSGLQLAQQLLLVAADDFRGG